MDNEFVVRDIKIIEGTNGYFVVMPSRKMSDHCDKCGGKNHLRAKYCNNCGAGFGGRQSKERYERENEAARGYSTPDKRRLQKENSGQGSNFVQG